MEEEKLLKRIANGDEEALARLIKLYKGRIFLYVYGLLRNYEDSEEATIETFFQVWRSAKRFKGRSKVSTWLFSIARNVAMKALRKRRHETLIFELYELDTFVQDVELPQDVELLRRAIEKLPPAQREVIHLAFYEELPYSEIAQILGVPESTVKTRVFYAKKKLRQVIKELQDES